jgi:hypothetical protein
MRVPDFTIDGVLPPYVGANSAGPPSDMTPYAVEPLDVVMGLGKTPARLVILRKWLDHRAALRTLGIVAGLQWLDGSFVEDKIPNDLDIVTLFRRPAAAASNDDMKILHAINFKLFSRSVVKRNYSLDAFFVDLNGDPEQVVNYSRYLLGLFSHRRDDDLWKGMLQVRLEDAAADAAAITEIDRLEALDAAEVKVA